MDRGNPKMGSLKVSKYLNFPRFDESTHPSWLNNASLRWPVTLEILTGMPTSVSNGASGTVCRQVEAFARHGSVQGAPHASNGSLDAQFPDSMGFLGGMFTDAFDTRERNGEGLPHLVGMSRRENH